MSDSSNDKKQEEKVNPYDPEVIERKKIIIAELVKNGKAVSPEQYKSGYIPDDAKLVYNPEAPTKAQLALMEECYIELNRVAVKTFNYYYGSNSISPLQLNQMLGALYCSFLNDFANHFPEQTRMPMKVEAIAHLFGMMCHILNINPVDAVPPEIYEELNKSKDDT